MPESQAVRSLRAQIAANTRWAVEPDRRAAVAPALAGQRQRFEKLVDPEGLLSPAERDRRVANARRAHMARMSLASAAARAARRAAG